MAFSLLGGILTFYDNQDLNIIGKDAINISLGVLINKNNWELESIFSQHIPISFKRNIVIHDPTGKSTSSIYGGGNLSFSIRRILN